MLSTMAYMCKCNAPKRENCALNFVEYVKGQAKHSRRRCGHRIDPVHMWWCGAHQARELSEEYRSTAPATLDRRQVILGSMIIAACPSASLEATAAEPVDMDVLASYAFQAYNDKDLPRAREYFSKIIARDFNPVWLERRGQVSVDMKDFEDALLDFNTAERLYRCAKPQVPEMILLHLPCVPTALW